MIGGLEDREMSVYSILSPSHSDTEIQSFLIDSQPMTKNNVFSNEMKPSEKSP